MTRRTPAVPAVSRPWRMWRAGARPSRAAARRRGTSVAHTDSPVPLPVARLVPLQIGDEAGVQSRPGGERLARSRRGCAPRPRAPQELRNQAGPRSRTASSWRPAPFMVPSLRRLRGRRWLSKPRRVRGRRHGCVEPLLDQRANRERDRAVAAGAGVSIGRRSKSAMRSRSLSSTSRPPSARRAPKRAWARS